MSEFYFTCPHCNAKICAEDEMIGQSGPCPGCGRKVTVEKKQPDEKTEKAKRFPHFQIFPFLLILLNIQFAVMMYFVVKGQNINNTNQEKMIKSITTTEKNTEDLLNSSKTIERNIIALLSSNETTIQYVSAIQKGIGNIERNIIALLSSNETTIQYVSAIQKGIGNLENKSDELLKKDKITDCTVKHFDREQWSFGIESEVKKMIQDGYEPIGKLCNDGINGAYYLFIKRGK